MKNKIYLGAYNVPPLSNDDLGASFTAPGNISKEVFDNIVFYGGEPEEETEDIEAKGRTNFDLRLEGILSVPKP